MRGAIRQSDDGERPYPVKKLTTAVSGTAPVVSVAGIESKNLNPVQDIQVSV
jgi:hypothetical protein